MPYNLLANLDRIIPEPSSGMKTINDPFGSPVLGSPMSLGHSPQPAFGDREPCGLCKTCNKWWKLTLDTPFDLLSNHNGEHLLTRIYSFTSTDGIHHYTLTNPNRPIMCYWASVYRKYNDIDDLATLHNQLRSPVLDTPLYLGFSTVADQDVMELGVRQNTWTIQAWQIHSAASGQTQTKKLVGVWIHEGSTQTSTAVPTAVFNCHGRNLFVPFAPEEFLDAPTIIIEPFQP